MNAKKMNKALKTAVAALSIVLVICLTVAGTLSFLQMKTGSVVNTFTTSDVNITLTESENLDLQMVPGDTIFKDPTVTVLADSEDCYVFVKIEKSANFGDYMEYDMAAGWNELTGVDGVSGVYYRKVTTSTADQPFAVLLNNQVTVLDEVTKADMTAAKTNAPTLTFTAYAIQSENLGDVTMAEIWNMAQGLSNG